MVVQMGLTRGLAAASQFASLTQPDDFVAGASPLRPKRFAHYNRHTITTLLFYFLSGVTPQTPNAEGIYKKQARVKLTDKRL